MWPTNDEFDDSEVSADLLSVSLGTDFLIDSWVLDFATSFQVFHQGALQLTHVCVSLVFHTVLEYTHKCIYPNIILTSILNCVGHYKC
jgi:hypothetical protein